MRRFIFNCSHFMCQLFSFSVIPHLEASSPFFQAFSHPHPPSAILMAHSEHFSIAHSPALASGLLPLAEGPRLVKMTVERNLFVGQACLVAMAIGMHLTLRLILPVQALTLQRLSLTSFCRDPVACLAEESPGEALPDIYVS